MENLPIFAATVLCGNLTQLDPYLMNITSGAFLALRLAYLVAYFEITTPRLSYIRSLFWMTSVVVCMYVMVSAGNVMAKGDLS